MSTVAVLRRTRFIASLIVIAGLSACGRDTGTNPGPGDSPGTFESDLPASAGDDGSLDFGGLRGESASAPSAAAGRSGAAAENAGDSDKGADVARTIVEADVIQLDGDRLYALSRMAGLAVIDASDPTQLRLLGSYRQLNGQPFEMYLRGDTAIMMFKGWGEYVATEDGDYTFQQISKIVALDVRDPAAMVTVGDFDVPGTIEDSRIVGDVLYVVGMEDGYCWGCEREQPATTISSLDVSNPSAIREVDTLRYSDATGGYSWKRSITVTDQRMYVAGPEYGRDGPVGSTIQVVDISNPSGDMVEGAVLQARGQISSRWQMDEYEGVLRVVSQPDAWRVTEERPRVQTFEIVSSREIRPLGSVDLVIPERETLRSARFDGPRGYVITAEQMDPLFTIDLSDPANPRQVGELEMPGFVYHMEPRGDRVLGLGFDQGNPEGSIAVSLFDVSDLAAPKMLSRVNFGGSWGWLPEDQDRIHKVWKVLTELDLLLVPFMGYEQTEDFCGSKNIGGVQLVDYFADTDELALRGSAGTQGEARRALIHRDHLFAVSDERVESFTMTDRSKPRAAGRVILASPVMHVKQLDGGVVARIASSYTDGRQRIELVSAEHADDPNQRSSELKLDELLGSAGRSSCESSAYIQSVHAQGDRLFVLYELYVYDEKSEGGQRRGVLVIDASDPADPQVHQGLQWSGGEWSTYYDYYSYGGFGFRSGELWHGSVLALLEQRYEYRDQQSLSYTRLRLVDLRDPEALRTSTLALPSGRRYSGLIADGERILTSHYQAGTDAASRRAKFYIDPFDISDPTAPKALDLINVPGALVHYDGASGRALTSQLSRVSAGRATYQQCAERFAHFEFDYGMGYVDENSDGDCVGYRQSLHLVELTEGGAVLEDTFTLDDDENVATWSAGDGVLFATLGRGGYYYGRFAGPAVDIACAGPCGGYSQTPKPVELLTLGGFGSGELAIGRLTVESDADPWAGFWGSPPIHAYGTSALLISQADVAIVDGSDAAGPRIERSETLIGPVQSVDIRDGRAAFALGERGVQFIDL